LTLVAVKYSVLKVVLAKGASTNGVDSVTNAAVSLAPSPKLVKSALCVIDGLSLKLKLTIVADVNATLVSVKSPCAISVP
jgi:hypothetical protein